MGYLNIRIECRDYELCLEFELNKVFSFITYVEEAWRPESNVIKKFGNCTQLEMIYVIDQFYEEIEIKFFILKLSLTYPVNFSLEEAKENFRQRNYRVVYKGQTLNKEEPCPQMQ